MSSLNLLFIGEGLVLSGAIEFALDRGHSVIGIFSTAPAEAEVMARAGLPVFGPRGSVADFVEAHDCDVLFSIANGHVLKAETLVKPRLAAINYHNAPLPAYAGMWATAWAVLNGETSHGVTWHFIEPGIDTGNILVQRRFPLTRSETAGSLNMRCTEAALESFPEVLGKLEQGVLAGEPQDFTHRSYFKRSDTVPGDGMIDWGWSAERILRLVRACDWGSSQNNFGHPKLVAPGGEIRIVRSASLAPGTGAPGAILGDDDGYLTVACADGAVRFFLASSPPLASGASIAPAERRRDSIPVDQATSDDDAPGGLPTVVFTLAALAAADPHRAAIEADGLVVSRQTLESRSQAYADALLASGLRPEDGVGILLPIGMEFVFAALGAMKAGGAYVPLAPSSPLVRLKTEIAEAGITHIVAANADALGQPDFPGVTVFAAGQLPRQDDRRDRPSVAADQCAYRIFTSGSTGRPKAVEITHGALANLAAHYRAYLPLDSSDRGTALAHPTFDASVADIWPVLMAGGTLLAPPEGILLDPSEMIRWLTATRATFTFMPTVIAERAFVQTWPEDMALRTLLTGGDTLHHRPPPGLPFRVVNTYGPTENTVDSLWAEVGPTGGRPPIGRPINGVRARVVDKDRKPAKPGEVGELVLEGAQVARGYRNRPDLTSRRFDLLPEGRRYYTGDLVRIDVDGDYEFHGRLDDQVQLLGVRVEPGEIEALLRADDRVAEAVCLPVRTGDAVTGLIAHVRPARGLDPTDALADELKALLAGQLPAAIVPRVVRLHETLPYMRSGKIDRAALANEPASQVTPAQPSEASDGIRAAWFSTVPIADERAEDQSFWDLGGDSLGAITLLMALEISEGVRVPVGLFLADPTLNGLRRAVAQRRKPVVTRLSEGKGPPLILWHTGKGDLEDYQNLQPLLSGRSVFGLLSPALYDLSCAEETIEKTVEVALASARAFGIRETPALLGYSWGGLFAFEAARQLARQGAPSPFVGLVGALPPFERRGRFVAFVEALPWAFFRTAEILLDWRKQLQTRLARPTDFDWRRHPLTVAHFAMTTRYNPPIDDQVEVTFFRERHGPRFHRRGLHFTKADRGWSQWVRRAPKVVWIDSDHLGMMKGEPAAHIARIVADELDKAAR